MSKRRRVRIGAGERMWRARRISTTFGRVYLGLRTQRWIERRLAPSDMEARWRGYHRDSARLVYGADVDLRNDQGMTTLLLSAKNGTSLRTLERLLAYGADRNARDGKGNTLLHSVAMNHKDSQAQERLAWALANGGDLESTNAAVQTPLNLVTGSGRRTTEDALANVAEVNVVVNVAFAW